MKIKTIEQAKELGLETHSYLNGDGEYMDINREGHTIKGNNNED